MAELMRSLNTSFRDHFAQRARCSLREINLWRRWDHISPQRTTLMGNQLVAGLGSHYVFNLTVTKTYLHKLLENSRVLRFLSSRHPDLLPEFQTISVTESI
jgi:hypothetical protein